MSVGPGGGRPKPCKTWQLDLSQLAQAGVAVAADNHMVVQYDAERGGSLLDILGHGDVGLRRGRIARGMIVHQDQRRGARLTTSRG